MAVIDTRHDAFDMARVVSRTFGAIGRNGAAFAVLALGLVAVPRSIVAILQAQLIPLAASGAFFNLTPGTWLRYGELSLGVGLLNIVFAVLLQAAVIRIVVQDLNDERARIADSLSAGLNVAVPVIFLGILIWLGVLLGFILFIVPGLMLATRWIVAVPVRVMERQTVLGAMGRSAQLTSGHRWTIFALMFAYMVVVWVFSAVFGQLLVSTLLTQPNALTHLASPPVLIFSALISAATSILAASGVAAIYCELRGVKEGVAPSALAAIFD